jgi:hypothetical protein
VTTTGRLSPPLRGPGTQEEQTVTLASCPRADSWHRGARSPRLTSARLATHKGGNPRTRTGPLHEGSIFVPSRVTTALRP